MIDYKRLLEKYMVHIFTQTGRVFVFPLDTVNFTHEEIAALNDLDVNLDDTLSDWN